jgi:hypothetical protein
MALGSNNKLANSVETSQSCFRLGMEHYKPEATGLAIWTVIPFDTDYTFFQQWLYEEALPDGV